MVLRILLICLAVTACESKSVVAKRTVTQKNTTDGTSGDAIPNTTDQEKPKVPTSNLGWDGKGFGETSTYYILPVE